MIKHDLPAKEMTAVEVQEQKWGELAPLSPNLLCPRPGGATQLYCCTHARPQVFRTHPKQVLSIGQIYTLFKYFRVLFWQFCPLNKYNP